MVDKTKDQHGNPIEYFLFDLMVIEADMEGADIEEMDHSEVVDLNDLLE